jgi:hypothetical protein
MAAPLYQRQHKLEPVLDRIEKAAHVGELQLLDNMVPRGQMENAKWRKMVLEAGAKSRDLRDAFRLACRKSIYFWLDTFIWCHDPRLIASSTLTPWITRPVQRPLFEKLNDAITQQHDLGIEKSRDEGASWGCLLTFLYFWMFKKGVDFLMVSRSAPLVDSPENPLSLYWKLDHALEHTPSWLIAPDEYRRTEMCLKHFANGGTITGATTTGQSGVGGRNTAMFMDEFPLIADAEEMWMGSQSTTGCRIINGTHTGTGSMFYRVLTEYPITKVMLGWWDNPEKNKGWEPGRNQRDIRGTSPWYEKECGRLGNNKQQIAAMLNVDPHGSSYMFFSAEEIHRLTTLYCHDPQVEGDLKDGVFTDACGGPLRIWLPVVAGKRPQYGEYVIGADVATGSQGKSGTPSCASVVNAATGEKVAEFASGLILTEDFGNLLVDLAKWFWNAKVCWESNGPGSSIRLRFIDHGYTNVYYRRNEKSVFNPVETTEMGWFSRPDTKNDALIEYRRALTMGEFLNRSERAMKECLEFVFNNQGNIESGRARSTEDPSGAKANHSDRVIADMLAWKLVAERGLVSAKLAQPKAELNQNSLAWRMAQWRQSRSDQEMSEHEPDFRRYAGAAGPEWQAGQQYSSPL